MPEREETSSFSGAEAVQGVGEAGKGPGERPDFKVVQAEYDTRIGKTIFKDVGAMWKNTSRSGNDFYTMKIGKLKLLVFPNRKE